MDKKQIEALVLKNKEQIIEWRRHLHCHPELSFEEFDTSDFIADRLAEMGYEIRRNIGGTGIVAQLNTGIPGPVIAFRADMDALPILEETGLPFASQNTGVMHGCGHDGHMAVLLGTSKVMAEMKDAFKGTIKFIFQPGEEANGGAKCVINDGALQNPPVEGIFALHMIPDLPTGTIGIKSGHLSATDDEFLIQVYGKMAHSSEPETGVNAIVIASQIVGALQSVLSTGIGPFDVATFSICQIAGGDAINVIPDYVEMRGMIRCIEKASKEQIRKRMTQIVEGTGAAMGGKGEIQFIPGFPSVNNDAFYTRIVMDAAETMLKDKDCCIEIGRPHMGSEDFAYYQEEIPGVMFMLGCAQEGTETGALHESILNFNEDALEVGVKIFVEIAHRICGK
ncbi:MAG: amidohydrolase [Firmicutes bacterium]|nr:amidohydrolase [Bacillota bacterium]